MLYSKEKQNYYTHPISSHSLISVSSGNGSLMIINLIFGLIASANMDCKFSLSMECVRSSILKSENYNITNNFSSNDNFEIDN